MRQYKTIQEEELTITQYNLFRMTAYETIQDDRVYIRLFRMTQYKTIQDDTVKLFTMTQYKTIQDDTV